MRQLPVATLIARGNKVFVHTGREDDPRHIDMPIQARCEAVSSCRNARLAVERHFNFVKISAAVAQLLAASDNRLARDRTCRRSAADVQPVR